jgi:hypothetical protein
MDKRLEKHLTRENIARQAKMMEAHYVSKPENCFQTGKIVYVPECILESSMPAESEFQPRPMGYLWGNKPRLGLSRRYRLVAPASPQRRRNSQPCAKSGGRAQ